MFVEVPLSKIYIEYLVFNICTSNFRCKIKSVKVVIPLNMVNLLSHTLAFSICLEGGFFFLFLSTIDFSFTCTYVIFKCLLKLPTWIFILLLIFVVMAVVCAWCGGRLWFQYQPQGFRYAKHVCAPTFKTSSLVL